MTLLSQTAVVGVLHVYLFLSQTEVHRLQTSEQHDQDRQLLCSKNGWLYRQSWKSQVCNKIPPSKKGFWQVLLTEHTKEISAFVTPQGLYQYKVMLFAMKNSLATFQLLIKKVITDLEDCKAYIDDVIIFSDTSKKPLRTTCEFYMRFLAIAAYYRRFCSWLILPLLQNHWCNYLLKR